jgi:hypothetical protein
MKREKLIAVTALFLSIASFSLAQTELYTAGEKTCDVFASYVAPERGISHLFETQLHNASMGGGLGATYFGSRTVGVGADINILNNGGSFVDSTTTYLLLRYPLGKSSGLAPYLLGGGGRGYTPSTQWIGQAGVGLEYRSYHKSGFFVEGRYVWGEKPGTDTLLLRGGLRLLF